MTHREPDSADKSWRHSAAMPGRQLSRASPAKPDAATLSRLYAEHAMSLAELARCFGVVPATIHNWLVAAGVPKRPGAATARGEVDTEEVRRLYVDEGQSAADIADRLGCSTSAVYHRLTGAGVPRRSRGSRRTAHPGDAVLRRLYSEQGLSLRQIAYRHDVSYQGVRGWLLAAGIERRPPRTPAPTFNPEEPAKLYGEGWTAPEIARRLGCSPATVYRRLQEAGVTRRPVKPSIGRDQLVAGLAAGLSAPDMAAAHSVSVSCVCRALAREGLATASQGERRRLARWYADRVEAVDPTP